MAVRLSLAYSGTQLSFHSREQRVIKLGLHSRAHVQLADPLVSRLHASIELGPGRATLVDLGTLAGTRVAGELVRGRRPLCDQDVITLGDTEVHVRLEPILELPIAVPDRRRDPAPPPAPPVPDLTLPDRTLPCRRGVGRDWLARDYVTSEKYDTLHLVTQLRARGRQSRRVVTLGVIAAGLAAVALPLSLSLGHGAPVPTIEAAQLFEPPAARAELAPTPLEHVVQRGDTLGTIAADRLGNRLAWRELWNANRDRLEDPSKLDVGTVLLIPEL